MAEEKSSSVFADVEELPPDAIFNTKAEFMKDPDAKKVNLGIGAYRTSDGKPKVLECVKKAEAILLENTKSAKQNKEYLPIQGDQEYVKLAQQLMLGESCKRIAEGKVVGVQSISGTGALRVLFDYIQYTMAAKNKGIKVLISNPTWGNHKKVIGKACLNFEGYTYWDAANRNLNLDGMLKDLATKGNKGDIVLLHGCAHNPTGVDPTKEQWGKIADAIKENGLVPFFDCAYQGFASGDLDKDGSAVRLFEERGFEFFLAQSFSKNLGLYCERAGCASVVLSDASKANAVMSQLCAVVRPMYSNPPAHGARIAKTVLSDKTLYSEWNKEMGEMSGRIIEMRKALRDELVNVRKTPGNWDHITSQIGMFSFTGLNEKQVMYMRSKWHIYFLTNGRISMAGVADGNVKYIAEAIDDAVRNCK